MKTVTVTHRQWAPRTDSYRAQLISRYDEAEKARRQVWNDIDGLHERSKKLTAEIRMLKRHRDARVLRDLEYTVEFDGVGAGRVIPTGKPLRISKATEKRVLEKAWKLATK